MDIFYYFYNELHLCVLLIATPYITELQLVITLCVNDCNYVATGLQLCSNWYTNGAATSRPVELQLAYPTGLQLAYHTSRN